MGLRGGFLHVALAAVVAAGACRKADDGRKPPRPDETTEAIPAIHPFAVGACEQLDPEFCPTGQLSDFDHEAFLRIYVDPFGLGPEHGLYRDEGAGTYTGRPVPMCEDATVPDPVSLDGDVDSDTWRCPDGQPVIRCADGTRPIVHYNPANPPSGTRWIVEISVGGAACTAETCLGTISRNVQRFSSVFSGSGEIGDPGTPTLLHHSSAGLMQRSDFRDFHRLIIDQCAGGRGLGGQMEWVPYDDGAQTHDVAIHHHGSRIVRAVLEEVLAESPAVPTQVVLSSNSNGSRGAYTEIDGWKTWLDERAGTEVDLRLYANSFASSSVDIELCGQTPGCLDVLEGFDHDADSWETAGGTIEAPDSTDLTEVCPDTGAGSCLVDDYGELRPEVPAHGVAFDTVDFYEGGWEGDAALIWGIELDESCVEAHPSEPEACRDAMHVLLHHLQTPTYLALSGYDRSMRSGDVSSCSASYEAFSLSDYNRRVVGVARAMGPDAIGRLDPPRQPGHAAWVDNSTDHQGATNTRKFDRTLERDDGSEVALWESLRAWLDAQVDHSPICVSDGAARNNPTNPMNTSHGGTALPTDVCF